MEAAITGAPLNFVRPHAKLRKSEARCTTTSVLRNRHSALRQSLKIERSILRNDICSVAPIHRFMHRFLAATALAGLTAGWEYACRKSIVLLTFTLGVVIPAIVFFV
ncbi:hypothetical protein HDF14_002920 [Edaphobacter lichenicola]|uniref:Uncharacterized protein n=1 Tax=Tunturiibacter gelidiferens TaxID=3069689 RepID=A0A9X0U609_9BACT|nr:hypothetical protein [Edaphobacter lichenicola]